MNIITHQRVAAAVLIATICLLGCGEQGGPISIDKGAPAAAAGNRAVTEPLELGPIQFRDIAGAAGLKFVHRSGATGKFTYPEIMSAGACLADLDNDGDLDVYLTQGGTVPGDDGEPGRNALFLNDGTGNFRDVSAASGADDDGYGMGAFAADVDQDGDRDLLLTNAGSLVLLSNQGDGTFIDTTAAAGLAERDGFWLNAVFADLNQDGQLDLYVANYTHWQPGSDPECHAPGGGRDYCNPTAYPGAGDLLFFGNGDGTFRDVTEESGVAAAATRSMGVVAFDVEQDGDLDLYVANDGEANLLWINQADGTFQDEAMVRGAALDSAGVAEASMGIACGDVDHDGDEDLILTHLYKQTNTLYRNDDGFFADASSRAGLAWSQPDTGFGVGLIDVDHDPFLDLFVANGGVARPMTVRDIERPYAQPDRCVRGTPRGRFSDASVIANDDRIGAEGAAVSRAAVFGDIDGDGRVDAVVAVKDGPVRLLRNETESNGSWIAVRPVMKRSEPAELHATVQLFGFPDTRLGVVRPHASYLGSSEETVRFGLGAHRQPVSVRVTWSDGTAERFDNLSLGSVHEVVRGSGTSAEKSLPTSRLATGAGGPSAEADASVTNSAPAAAGDQALTPSDLPTMPALELVRIDALERQAKLDESALAAWCQLAGLPAPPELKALDAPTWALVHPAIEAAGRTPDAKSLGELAMFYDGHGVAESAIALYERLVKVAPDDVRWWHLLGRATSELGQYERAAAALEQAAELSQEYPAILARLGESQLAIGQTEKSLATWRAYTQLRPQDPYGYTGLAQAAEESGDLTAAREAAQTALGLNVQARPAFVLAARVSARLGDQDAASQFSSQAAQLTDKDDPILTDKIDFEMRTFARSVSYLRKAVNFYKEQGRFKEAMHYAKLLAERRPKEAQNWKMLTWLSTVMNQPRELKRYSQIAVKLDPSFAPGWNAVAVGQLEANQPQEALQSIAKALTADPHFAQAYVTRGLILGSMQRWSEALPSLDRGLKRKPNDVNGWVMKAMCHLQTGDKASAKNSLDRVLKLAPNHPWANKMRPTL